ncbi:MAG: hypothetical protein GTO55_02950 [Armatimonadetes bacterium]|nr:hypothetical protein [Armatimonadota bacterium]NIM23234.1 hypothetical protein [Armatimonadota bacterium]NIM67102.1 hypothetical protein [Armatimonadota bacterium]NIM75629.1 hypothetical protein [Armatimonadota bacterium]NIN05291.1 hypothetical protein [Armatimonadota bacterium]
MRLEDREWDVVIAGASFAGLSAAAHLKGRVLVLGSEAVGSVQRSACGAPAELFEELELQDAVLQIHHNFWLHTANDDIRLPLERAFCTFDYARLSMRLLERSEAAFLRCRALGIAQDGLVMTSVGPIKARAVIDATGWHATLASSIRSGFGQSQHLSFGLESEVDCRGEDMHFYFDPDILPHGVAWIFPAGEICRLGVGSYRGQTRAMGNALHNFVSRHGQELGSRHGGFLPYQLRASTVGPIFVCGDAAGQCLPLTGEGIRTSIYFGVICARHIQQFIDGRCTLSEAQRAYRAAVRRHRNTYHSLSRLQWLINRLPNRLTSRLVRGAVERGKFQRMMNLYLDTFVLSERTHRPLHARIS